MNFIKTFLLVAIGFSLVSAEDKEIKSIFDAANLEGTLLITSLEGDKSYLHNKERSTKGFIPASTFKIANTLIALEEKVIEGEDEIIKWDGTIHSYSSWNKDHNLQSAIAASCVWCYQKFAKDIGDEKYLNYLKQLNYGNQKTGPELTRFWLDGDIRISAREQIEFLKKLYRDQLSFQQKYIDITKKILTVKQTGNYSIKAKTGFSGKIGWYVGYVETKKGVWFFALNADVTTDKLKYRKQIVMQALRAKKII